MTSGFPASYQEEFLFEDLSPEQFFRLAIEALKSLNWPIEKADDAEILAHTPSSPYAGGAAFSIRMETGHAILECTNSDSPVSDSGLNRNFIGEFRTTFNTIRQSAANPGSIAQYETPCHDIEPPPEFEKLTFSEKFLRGVRNFLALFTIRENYLVTPVMLNINIAVFLLMVFSGVNIMQPDSQSLITFGANFRPFTLNGEWWRLLTCCFVHIGLMHLLMNMYALLYIGILLEPRLGKERMFAAYLLAGIASSAASLWWHDATVSAGASGAIFGLYGVFLALLTTNLIEKQFRKPLLMSISFFVFYNLAYGMKEGIDNAGHLGGLLSGIVIGYGFSAGLRKPDNRKLQYLIIASLSILTIGMTSYIVRITPNVLMDYNKMMKKFVVYEDHALRFYRASPNLPKATLLQILNDSGIYYWNKNIKLLNDAEKLQLPPYLKAKNDKLVLYVRLRLETYHLIEKAIIESTDIYNTSIDSCDNMIRMIIEELQDTTGFSGGRNK